MPGFEWRIPANPSVPNTTRLSNVAYIGKLQIAVGLSGICTVPVIRRELEHGVDDYPYLQSARYTLSAENPVATISDTVANRETALSDHLDPDESQAFALPDAEDGRLLTDDGDARSVAKDQGVTVVGSIGVLLAAIDGGKIDEAATDEWLSTRIDEIGYYVPYRTISEYR